MKPNPLTWALTLGGVGFAAGFLGPMIFAPDANQGPLLGIFISGPAGAVLGLVLGLSVRFIGPLQRFDKPLLAAAAAVLAAATLFACMPAPKYLGVVIDAEVLDCSAPSTRVDDAIDSWQRRIAAASWASPRPGWQEELRALAQTDPGVVLRMHVLRERRVVVNQKPWNRGTLVNTPWQDSDSRKRYYARFAGADCSAYRQLERAVYWPTADIESAPAWPQRALPNLLDLMVLGPVPATYREAGSAP